MNKSELKTKWGKYTDTDKLVEDIRTLLTTYRHRNSEHGVCVMLDRYFTHKQSLIELLSKSKNYAGDMRIITNKEFDRGNLKSDIQSFCREFLTTVDAKSMLLSYKDDDGKTISDHIKTGKTFISPSQLHDKKVKTVDYYQLPFTCEGYTKASDNICSGFHNYINKFYYITDPTLSDNNEKNFAEINSNIKLAKGMKTSRAFNRVCDTYGISKSPHYNKLFARYADMVSGLTRNLDFVISVNPYDYLTMSFGNSWSSCHTIDKNNLRRLPTGYSGGYCGGTLSYMLDKSSIITYVIDKNEDPREGGKIYRNMFHYGNNTLIQSRIYPQGNDGATDLYTKFREFMHAEFNALFETEDEPWTVKKGKDWCQENTTSYGVHYRDYIYVRDCNVSYLANKERQRRRVEIGSTGICPYCGQPITSSSSLSHSSCSISN